MPDDSTSSSSSSTGSNTRTNVTEPVADAPLPAPTTLATHTTGPRLLRSSRSSSRTSRGSQSNSSINSRAGTPNSTRSRRSRASRAALPDTGPRAAEPSPSESEMRQLEDELQPRAPSPPPAAVPAINISPRVEERVRRWREPPEIEVLVSPPAKRRRRAYSIHDEVGSYGGPGPSMVDLSSDDIEIIPLPGEASSSKATLDAHVVPPPSAVSPSSSSAPSRSLAVAPQEPIPEPLSAYTCPICFSAPTNATLTPCGHVCCGECLFTAVRASLQRVVAAIAPEPLVARCPVCRAVLKGWDGRGGGVIGLKPRTMFSL